MKKQDCSIIIDSVLPVVCINDGSVVDDGTLLDDVIVVGDVIVVVDVIVVGDVIIVGDNVVVVTSLLANVVVPRFCGFSISWMTS